MCPKFEDMEVTKEKLEKFEASIQFKGEPEAT